MSRKVLTFKKGEVLSYRTLSAVLDREGIGRSRPEEKSEVIADLIERKILSERSDENGLYTVLKDI